MPRSLLRLFPAVALLFFSFPSCAQSGSHKAAPWLFAGFKGNSEDGVYYAISPDGYHWTLANGGKPVVHQTEPGELMRDPFLQRAPSGSKDGAFRMVWTWGWRSPVIGYSSSDDLVHWTPHRQLPVIANEPSVLNVWAPALYWEPAPKRWLLFWSSTIPGRFPGEDSGDGGLNHRIFSTTTAHFTTFTPAKTFFDPGFSVIDATLIQTQHTFHLIFKDERKTPLEKHLLTAESGSMEGPWTHISDPISEPWSEGAAIIPVANGYLAYYDHYTKPQHYAARFTSDFIHWTDATDRITFPPGMRHGSFLQITRIEYERLAALK